MAKRLALRRGVWFKWLSSLERAEVDLTIRVVAKVQSMLLRNVLTSILQKLSTVAESEISRLKRSFGVPLARKLSLVARSWGYKSAENWPKDEGFVQFLTVCYVNLPGMFRT